MANEIYSFRIHEGTVPSKNENGWQKSGGFDYNTIASIPDSMDQMPSSGKIGTSIPTPFARLYLFKTAFELVTTRVPGAKASVYDELVSDCLDILQLLFEKGGDIAKFEFIPWNKDDEARILRAKNANIARNNPGYNALDLLADSFDLAAGTTPEFANGLTLIKYDGMLLGGTSPFTFVFTSPNLRYELAARKASEHGYDFSSNKKVQFCAGGRIPLSQRPKEFQAFLRTMVNNKDEIELFAQGGPFKTFADYVNAQTEGLDTYSDEEYGQNFKEIHGLHIMGLAFRWSDLPPVLSDSHFLMRPSVSIWRKYMSSEPLVIPCVHPSTGWVYVDDDWDTKTQLPDLKVKSAGAFSERKLPKNGSAKGEPSTLRYPWVSNCDFLTDNIIDLDFETNTQYFFNPASQHPRFLLPIKKEYFMFFTLEDLKEQLKMTVDAKEIRNDNNEVIDVKLNKVTVELEIPLKSIKRSIKFTREYFAGEDKYCIKKAKSGFGLGIFPFYRINEKELPKLKNQYSVYLYNSDRKADAVQLRFYNNESNLVNPLNAAEVLRNCVETGTSKVYNLRSTTSSNSFDIIEVLVDDGNGGKDSGLVIPRWKDTRREICAENMGNDSMKTIFSIDFGTSNTHVAYWNPDDHTVNPFEIKESDIQMVLLNKPYVKDNVTDYREPTSFGKGNLRFSEHLREFVPSVIGDGQMVSYPIKTATLESKELSSNGRTLFGNINIGYDVENEKVRLSGSSFIYTTNLKWALQEDKTDNHAKHRVEAFCEQTLWMLKNLLVLKGFCPNGIKVIYFYPESMMEDDKQMFKKAWNGAVKEVFTDCGFMVENNECLSELESVAPYYSLLKVNPDIYAYNSVNIDIGGGTTDILIFDRKYVDPSSGRQTAAYESSIYFAGNDIWGKMFPSLGGGKNGFVEFMKSKVGVTVLQPETSKAYEYFGLKEEPAEMSNFFFKYQDFKYATQIASHPKLRLVLFLHYASIIFYVSDMIKQVKKQQNPDFVMPSTLTFTGKGSEYIKIITPEESTITKITAALFLAFGFDKSEFKDGFRITYPQNPKGLTAEGGVYKLNCDKAIKVEFVKKEDDVMDFLNHTSADADRDKTMYENLSTYLLGFEKEDGKSYTVSGLNSYKDAVMSHFDEMIDAMWASDLLKNTLKSLGMSLEADDKLKVKELAIKSFDNHAKKFIYEHAVGSAELDGTIFFLAMKNLLIDLSLYYVNL